MIKDGWCDGEIGERQDEAERLNTLWQLVEDKDDVNENDGNGCEMKGMDSRNIDKGIGD